MHVCIFMDLIQFCKISYLAAFHIRSVNEYQSTCNAEWTDYAQFSWHYNLANRTEGICPGAFTLELYRQRKDVHSPSRVYMCVSARTDIYCGVCNFEKYRKMPGKVWAGSRKSNKGVEG
jgi:hypothetical protein